MTALLIVLAIAYAVGGVLTVFLIAPFDPREREKTVTGFLIDALYMLPSPWNHLATIGLWPLWLGLYLAEREPKSQEMADHQDSDKK